MEGTHNLSAAEADWLSRFGRGEAAEPESDLGIPPEIVASLIRRGLLCRDHGWLDITLRGMSEALRLSTPATPARQPVANDGPWAPWFQA